MPFVEIWSNISQTQRFDWFEFYMFGIIQNNLYEKFKETCYGQYLICLRILSYIVCQTPKVVE